MEHIHPTFDKIIGRDAKESLLGQFSKVIWLTGLSGSGKTTLAIALEKELYKMGLLTQILDGDNIRSGINNNLKFSLVDRNENIRRIAEVTKLFLNCGVIPINCFISPTVEIRELAKSIIGPQNIIVIHVKAPLAVCEKRDVKGLYKKARAGEIKNFTGIDSPYEDPLNPDIVVETDKLNIEQSIEQMLTVILPLLKTK